MTTDDNSVIIEPEEQASERSQKETAGKKQRKKIGRFYRWQIVLVVVIAVVAVSGLGFYKWHESPASRQPTSGATTSLTHAACCPRRTASRQTPTA